MQLSSVCFCVDVYLHAKRFNLTIGFVDIFDIKMMDWEYKIIKNNPGAFSWKIDIKQTNRKRQIEKQRQDLLCTRLNAKVF